MIFADVSKRERNEIIIEVISLSKNKVMQINYNNKIAYLKRTVNNEVQNIKIAKKFLSQVNSIVINEKQYKIKVPEIYTWDCSKNILIMEECIGNNLEIMLRSVESRKLGIQVLHSIMKFILDENFYWHDFAPRNILFNDLAAEISIVDFEKGITLDSNTNILHYFREGVYEEYSAFLLPEERPISADTIYSLHNEKDYYKNINDLKSNRIKLLAREYGYSQKILYSQYLQLIKLLVIAEEPFQKHNKIVFPIVELEDILQKKGYANYISMVLEKNSLFLGDDERYE